MEDRDSAIWTWVNVPADQRPTATGPGRYSRPLSVRDRAVAASFGQEIRRLRTRRDLSTYDLAMMVGMSQPSIVKIETDCRASIELRLLWDFADALGVKPAHLMRVCQRRIEAEEAQYFSRKGSP